MQSTSQIIKSVKIKPMKLLLPMATTIILARPHEHSLSGSKTYANPSLNNSVILKCAHYMQLEGGGGGVLI